MNEEWRAIPGYEGLYEVSDLGRVKTLARHGRCERIMRVQWDVQHHEYPQVTLTREGRKGPAKIHQLVLFAFVGPRPTPEHQACHNNGDRGDNRLVNLRWDTASENVLDRVRHGTHHHVNKTHCPQGHPYSGDNLIVSTTQQSRTCRECKRTRNREYWRKKYGKAAA